MPNWTFLIRRKRHFECVKFRFGVVIMFVQPQRSFHYVYTKNSTTTNQLLLPILDKSNTI